MQPFSTTVSRRAFTAPSASDSASSGVAVGAGAAVSLVAAVSAVTGADGAPGAAVHPASNRHPANNPANLRMVKSPFRFPILCPGAKPLHQYTPKFLTLQLAPRPHLR